MVIVVTYGVVGDSTVTVTFSNDAPNIRTFVPGEPSDKVGLGVDKLSSARMAELKKPVSILKRQSYKDNETFREATQTPVDFADIVVESEAYDSVGSDAQHSECEEAELMPQSFLSSMVAVIDLDDENEEPLTAMGIMSLTAQLDQVMNQYKLFSDSGNR